MAKTIYIYPFHHFHYPTHTHTTHHRKPAKSNPVSSIGNSILLCPHGGFMFTYDSLLQGDAQQWVTSYRAWLDFPLNMLECGSVYFWSHGFKNVLVCVRVHVCVFVCVVCVCLSLHSVALLWPAEWEVICRLFLVDQTISICRIRDPAQDNGNVQYHTQPGKHSLINCSTAR